MKRKQPEDKILNCKCLLRSSAKMPLLSFSTGVTVSSVAPFQAWVISAIFRLVLFLPSHPPQASGKTYTAPSSPNSEVEVVSLASFLRYFHFVRLFVIKQHISIKKKKGSAHLVYTKS